MSSYKKFNYGTRPAKSIERKLFTELLREFYGVSPDKKLEYVGLGSPFFIDFKIMHKELNIQRMVNIENKTTDKKRFQFNKPFYCIDLKWGDTSNVLPSLNWGTKKIIWLDYDSSLDQYMFEDLDIVFSNLISGSFYLFSCNSSLPRYKSDQDHNIDQFKKDFEGISPPDATKEDLTNSKSPTLIWMMIHNRIAYLLDQRNAALSDDKKLIYQQLINITYKDGAPMITTGGVILEKSKLNQFLQLRLHKLSYIRKGKDFLDIQTAIVTNQEINLMNNFLPSTSKKFLQRKKLDLIPEKEKTRYLNTYRYYPYYVEMRE